MPLMTFCGAILLSTAMWIALIRTIILFPNAWKWMVVVTCVVVLGALRHGTPLSGSYWRRG